MSEANDDHPPISIRVRQRPRTEMSTTPAPEAAAEDEEAYAVGYKHPPLASRFQPGRSGNPKGRPKGSKNWSTILAEAAGRQRTIGVGGKKVRMSGREAVAEQLVINAIKGDPKARRDFLNEMRLERQQQPSSSSSRQEAEPLSANDEALLADFLKRAGSARTDGDGS